MAELLSIYIGLDKNIVADRMSKKEINCTVIPARGFWLGHEEDSCKVEVISDSPIGFEAAISALKELAKQYFENCIYITITNLSTASLIDLQR